jgi:hypothetical protein
MRIEIDPEVTITCVSSGCDIRRKARRLSATGPYTPRATVQKNEENGDSCDWQFGTVGSSHAYGNQSVESFLSMRFGREDGSVLSLVEK